MGLSSRATFDGRLSGVHGLTNFSLRPIDVWDDCLKVGQPEIDAQHEEILGMAKESSDAWRKHRDLDQLKAITAKLHAALIAHFSYEEQVLAEIGYADLVEHRAEHQELLDEMRLIRARVDEMASGGDDTAPGFLLTNYIVSTTVGHIFHSDMDYCVSAREAAGRTQLEAALP